MLSIYVHIPFCDVKCGYCSFSVIAEKDLGDAKILEIKKQYLDALTLEIKQYAEILGKEHIKSIFIGGGTPSSIGKEGLISVIKTLEQYFDLQYLEELSIELNPNPFEKVFDIIQHIQQEFPHFMRIRRSIGIQSLDDVVLRQSGRQYTFEQLQYFLRKIPELKKDNCLVNLDFMAFGKLGNDGLPWDAKKREFFRKLVHSHFYDGISVYMLEIFPGCDWYYDKKNVLAKPIDDNVYAEFSWIKKILLSGGYKRYELSNFSLLGKSSIHNRVYRTMQSYLGLGLASSSFLNKEYVDIIRQNVSFSEKIVLQESITLDTQGVRWKNTQYLSHYNLGEFVDKKSFIGLDQQSFAIEKFFLDMRIDEGVSYDEKVFDQILVANRQQKITDFVEQGFLVINNGKLKCTDKGWDVYNTLITELLREV